MIGYHNRRSRRRAKLCPELPLFDWAATRDLLADPAVRRIARVGRVSPAVASVYADLLGYGGRRGR